jgi:glutamine amidotransferase
MTASPAVAVVDYESGNLCSVSKALEKLGATVRIVSSPEGIPSADALVLPGVGAFRDAMHKLERLELVDPIREAIDSGKPFFGICLGLQLLFAEGLEDGVTPGLGVLPGRVVRFELDDPALKIPHMGWNRLKVKQRTPVLEGLDEETWVYFVHSYYVAPEDDSVIATTTDYGIDFTSSVARDNVFASQFHPEKSQSVGLAMLENFLKTV